MSLYCNVLVLHCAVLKCKDRGTRFIYLLLLVFIIYITLKSSSIPEPVHSFLLPSVLLTALWRILKYCIISPFKAIYSLKILFISLFLTSRNPSPLIDKIENKHSSQTGWHMICGTIKPLSLLEYNPSFIISVHHDYFFNKTRQSIVWWIKSSPVPFVGLSVWYA